MPTGYTWKVKDGQSFEEFVWGCARAMGALIMMRDDPPDAQVPERFEPSDWHTKQLAKELSELDRLGSMTPEQVEMEAEAEYIDSVNEWLKRETERVRTRDAYDAMLQKVDAWDAPPSHLGFKDFMRRQLLESMDFDTGHQYEKPERVTSKRWLDARIARARKSIAYHEEMHSKEVARTEERNRWLTELRASIPTPKSYPLRHE